METHGDTSAYGSGALEWGLYVKYFALFFVLSLYNV